MAARKTQAPAPEFELPICEDCWPDGWPDKDVAATCGHGEWSRYPMPEEPVADGDSPQA